MGRGIVNIDNKNKLMGRAIVNYDFVDDSEMNSSIEGDLVKYAVEYSSMGVPNPNIIEDRNLANGEISSGDFYDAVGKPNLGGDDFYDATGEEEDTFAEDSMPDQSVDQYENARGKKRRKGFVDKYMDARAERRKNRSGFFNKLLDVQKQRQEAKFGAKDKMAQAQLESARQQGALAQSDVATASALANASKSSGSSSKTSSEGKSGWSGLSKNAKIGIVIGGVAVLGFVGYMLLKKKK
jgi:hypothetical protein